MQGCLTPRLHFGTVYNPIRDELVIYGGNSNQHVTLLHRIEPKIKSHHSEITGIFSPEQLQTVYQTQIDGPYKEITNSQFDQLKNDTTSGKSKNKKSSMKNSKSSRSKSKSKAKQEDTMKDLSAELDNQSEKTKKSSKKATTKKGSSKSSKKKVDPELLSNTTIQ